MLKVNNIKKSFNNNIILQNVSFEAPSGLLTILEGENGAGKSTLFNILGGTINQDEGTLLFNSQDISLMPAKKRALFMAVLKQDPKASSSPALSVLENCAIALLKEQRASLRYALRNNIREKILFHLHNLDLSLKHLLNKPMGELSGGQRQIFAFAMATIVRPKILLLDEPTAALDEKSSYLLMRLIKRLIKEWQIPAVMISHDHTLNQTYGDKVLVLKDGLIKHAVLSKP